MENKNFNWRPMSEYTGGRVLATNGLDVLIGEINSDGDCESEEDSGTILCGITGFIKIEEILPKSEDERTRKELIAFVDATTLSVDERHDRWIAWLEKQGWQKPTAEEVLIKAGLKPYKDGDQWCVLLGDNIQEGICGFGNTIEDALYAFLKDLIASQGEQKPYGQRKECTDCQFNYAGECKGYCDMKRGEQKPADKVEPKFKAGDFIVNDYCMGRIVEITNDAYLLDTEQGIPFSCHSTRLWDITKDAKDGDVLNSMRVQATIIFKGFADDGKHILAYCALQKGIFIKQEMLWDRDFEPCPKNWNNELFSKMKEAGYEWDADKKQLKKISDKSLAIEPNFKEGDVIREKETGNVFLVNSVEDFGYTLHYKNCTAKGCTMSFKDEDKYELVEQKPAWSEEDEEILDGIIADVEVLKEQDRTKTGKAAYQKEIDWLKPLKDRVQLQNIACYNPYKEVVESITEMCKHYDKASHSGLRDFYDNVKVKCKDAKEYDSLYPQSTWKPSDEQMEALYEETQKSERIRDNRIVSLYEDLKKIRA